MWAGVDTHKDTLAVAVIDGGGRELARRVVSNTEVGFTKLAAVLAAHRVLRVGIEGSGNYGRAAAVHLALLDVVEVVEVPPLLTARERSARPAQGKTDPIDALAIARITAREPDLPQVRLTVGPAADLRALLDYRQQLVDERTATANRVHIELCGLHPGYHQSVPRLTAKSHVRTALALLEDDHRVRAELTRRRLHRLVEIDRELFGLHKQIAAGVAAAGTALTDIYGIGIVVAARILAEVVDVRRYPSRHAFAAANGSAPIPASSGRTVRHRLNRGGNRQLNRCLYTVAITEIRADTEGRAYYLRKRAQGKTSREALRCLKRRLSDIVYRTLSDDLAREQEPMEEQVERSAAPSRVA